MEQNTGRMWWTIGIIVLGGLLIAGFVVIANTNVMPQISKRANALIATKPKFETKVDALDRTYIDKVDYTAGGDIEIPSKIDGKKVSWISKDAFLDADVSGISFASDFDGSNIWFQSWDEGLYGKHLKSVELPNGLKYIGSYKLNNVAIDSVIVPEGVTAIGSNSFSAVKSITLPSTLTSYFVGATFFPEGTIIKVPKGLDVSGSGSIYIPSHLVQRY